MPATVRCTLPFSAVPVAPNGGVYVIVIVQLPPGVAGVPTTPGLTGVPTAQVPPSAKVPVPVGRVSCMRVGIHGPASRLDPAGHGAAKQRFAVLVIVMVLVCATVLAGVVVNAGVSGVTLMVAIVS